MIVLDASALIAYLDPSDALHRRAVAIVLTLDGGALGVSPISHAEVLVGPTRAGTVEQTQAALADLGVAEIGIAEDAALRLATLRVRTKLKLPDCCVILAAQQSRGTILTFDTGLAAAARNVAISVQAVD